VLASRTGGSYVGIILGSSSDDPTTCWMRPVLKGWVADPNGKLTPADVLYSWDDE
jgi:hypothetical protein